ncbi:hypothetical protein [Actinokineospora bangkokensis]|uniref:ESX-1 secretion-associated protein n=1 Tax=Actinokineospora bangkokensis TaxID=1193682 RepID=A0A1Q9LDA1_9PSEU|nr:hypothetical protein [Actinokineospora bangkokensis]OLR89992.1 hypothetical protein BJP25_03150 [Actinokineospora bangkokensis]
MSSTGFLAVDPGAAERAAGACRAQIARLDVHIRAAEGLADPDFGACALGRGLSGKFVEKRTAGDGLIARLRMAREGLESAARHFEATAAAYRATEEGAERALRFTGNLEQA